MEQPGNQSEFNPWYLDADGNPLPMDQMMSAMYPGSTRGAWVNELPSEQNDVWENQEEEPYARELEEWKKRYPEKIQILEQYIEDACEALDYDGSVIYDEQPDAWAMEQLCRAIGRQIMEDLSSPLEEDQVLATDLYPSEEEWNALSLEQNETSLRTVSCRGCGGKWDGRPPRPFPPKGPRPPRPFPPPKPRPPHLFPPPDFRPPHGPRPFPPPKPYPFAESDSAGVAGQHGNWIQDIIPVLLFQEIYKRRCNRRKCQNRYV